MAFRIFITLLFLSNICFGQDDERFIIYHLEVSDQVDSLKKELINDNVDTILIYRLGLTWGFVRNYPEGTKKFESANTAYIFWADEGQHLLQKVDIYAIYEPIQIRYDAIYEFYEKFKEEIQKEKQYGGVDTIIKEGDTSYLYTSVSDYSYKKIDLTLKNKMVIKTMLNHYFRKAFTEQYLENYAQKQYTWAMIIEEWIKAVESRTDWVPLNLKYMTWEEILEKRGE